MNDAQGQGLKDVFRAYSREKRREEFYGEWGAAVAYRPLSLLLTPLFLKLGVAPTAVTAFAMVIVIMLPLSALWGRRPRFRLSGYRGRCRRYPRLPRWQYCAGKWPDEQGGPLRRFHRRCHQPGRGVWHHRRPGRDRCGGRRDAVGQRLGAWPAGCLVGKWRQAFKGLYGGAFFPVRDPYARPDDDIAVSDWRLTDFRLCLLVWYRPVAAVLHPVDGGV